MPEPTEQQAGLELARERSSEATQEQTETPAERQQSGLRRRREVWQVFLAGEHWHLAERKMVTMWVASVSGWLVDAMLLGDQENLGAAVDILTKAHNAATQTSTIAEPFIAVLLRTATAAQLRV